MNLIQAANADVASEPLYERLVESLEAGKRVLWLLSGGSNISVCTAIMSRIDGDLTNMLSVALGDERYGSVGHTDSNWQQLEDSGFDSKNAQRLAVLAANDQNLEATSASYADALQSLWQQQDVVIGLFGMGPDGHIAGILPHSPAATSTDFVTSYHTDQYDRITIGFPAISKCSAAYVLAFGSSKREALENLQQDIDLQSQPAQIIKSVPEAYVFNDQIGDPQ